MEFKWIAEYFLNYLNKKKKNFKYKLITNNSIYKHHSLRKHLSFNYPISPYLQLKPITMKKIIMFIYVLISCIKTLEAQETAFAIFASVDKVMTGLHDLQQRIGGTIAISINQASQNLNAHQQELKQMIGSKITEPMQNLNLNIQNQIRLLRNTAENLNQLLSWQQECIFKNADIFKAGMLTAGLQLESNLRFIGKTNDPLVNSISFDGKPAYLVPIQGGRVTIKGFNLYKDYAPIIRIHNEKRTTIILDNVAVGRAGNNNDISIYIDASFINKNLGSIIYFEIIPRKSRWLIGGPTNLRSVFIPLKIPEVNRHRYKIKSYVSYKWVKNETFELNDQQWGKEEQNSNCGETRAAQDVHTWNICDECTIINVKGGQTGERYMNDGGNIIFSIPARDKIAYAGTIGRPSCIKALFVSKLLSHAYWRFSVWPEVKKTSYIEELQSNTSDIFSLDDNQKNILVTLPVNPNQRRETVFWYQLISLLNNGAEQIMYTSPRYSSDDNGVISDTYTKNDGYRFDASLNNKTTNNTVQVNTRISAPPCGAF